MEKIIEVLKKNKFLSMSDIHEIMIVPSKSILSRRVASEILVRRVRNECDN